ncbi:MAG: HAD family hydrolase [Actinomycetota bacterium]|nr:HAD family hydrolase [Actinomycetota bacterium]
MPRWQAIVFDLDDTLYPEEAYVHSGFRAVAAWGGEHLDIPATQGYIELERLFREGVRGRTFDAWLAGHGLSSDGVVGELVRIYRAHAPAIAPFPEAPALLDRLAADHALGLLSDGGMEVQNGKLDALGLRRCFDAVVITDELGREAWKPSPRGFEVLLERLGGGLDPERTVYVSDNPVKDFLGARRAGLWSIRVRTAHGIYAHLEPETHEHAADAEVAGLEHAEAMLAQLAG